MEGSAGPKRTERATIVMYRDNAVPVNEYPNRIVSPSHAARCCADNMSILGPGRIEGTWRYRYHRCGVCGFTVRRAYGVSHLAVARRRAAQQAHREEAS